MKKTLLYIAGFLFVSAVSGAQTIDHYLGAKIDYTPAQVQEILSRKSYPHQYANSTDESAVPQYTLPSVLTRHNGKEVKTVRAWEKYRRPEILETFASQMYGHVPAAPKGLYFELKDQNPKALGGTATQKHIWVGYDKKDPSVGFDLMLMVPNGVSGPVPVMTALNFYGNDELFKPQNAYRWPFEEAISQGFAVATAWHEQIEPDVIRRGQGGVRDYISADWGAISAWAWGLSRIMDYIQTDPTLDKDKVMVFGQSRLGKVALWAGANDQRFAMVVSNCSGCCGAAISRREFGENFNAIRGSFPYWFCDNFAQYSDQDFPLDQHCLAALIAPRQLYIGSAQLDTWADPKGEWLSAVNAGPVYELYGLKGLECTEQMPAVGRPDNKGSVAYKLRYGSHGITYWDWAEYIATAKRAFGIKDEPKNKGLLKEGELIALDETYVRRETVLSVHVEAENFQKILVGRGIETPKGWTEHKRPYCAYTLVISKDSIEVRRYLIEKEYRVYNNQLHGLKIGSSLDVTLEKDLDRDALLTLSSDGNSVTIPVSWWGGGEPFVQNLGTEPILAEVNFDAKALDRDLWIIGDSYINWENQNRWPYFMVKAGYTDWMSDHLPGGNSPGMIKAFKRDLAQARKKPKYAVWAMGMNDGRDDDGLNQRWLYYVTEFIRECNRYGITPVLTTVPAVPKRNHTLKSPWVRESGYKYVDFAAAVNIPGTQEWVEGSLDTDLVHPSPMGAELLWEAFRPLMEEVSSGVHE